MLDDEDNPLITLGQGGEGYPAIWLHGELDSGRLDSIIYTFGEGDIVLLAGDATYVCIWEGRIDVCEINEDGLLYHID